MSRVRMGVVGLGQWGRHHVRILAQLPSVDLVGVVDRDGREAIHLAHRFETRPYEDHRGLLGKVAGVSLAVPPALHYQITRDFLEAGAHVLVEKPMTVTAEEAAHLVDLAARQDRLVLVGDIERLQPGGPAPPPASRGTAGHRGAAHAAVRFGPDDGRGRRHGPDDPRHRHRPIHGAGALRRPTGHRRLRAQLARRPGGGAPAHDDRVSGHADCQPGGGEEDGGTGSDDGRPGRAPGPAAADDHRSPLQRGDSAAHRGGRRAGGTRIAPLRGARPWRRAPPGHRRGRPALAAGDRSAARPDDPDPPAPPRLALPSRGGTREVRSSPRLDLIDITDRVAAALPERTDGALVLFTPHATAALLLNEHEEHLLGDIRAWLGAPVPEEASYAHNRIDHNADAALRAILR